MPIVYAPFWKTLKKQRITQYALRHKMGLSAGTLDNLKQNRHVSTKTLEKVCDLVGCNISDIIEYIPKEGQS